MSLNTLVWLNMNGCKEMETSLNVPKAKRRICKIGHNMAHATPVHRAFHVLMSDFLVLDVTCACMDGLVRAIFESPAEDPASADGQVGNTCKIKKSPRSTTPASSSQCCTGMLPLEEITSHECVVQVETIDVCEVVYLW